MSVLLSHNSQLAGSPEKKIAGGHNQTVDLLADHADKTGHISPGISAATQQMMVVTYLKRISVDKVV